MFKDHFEQAIKRKRRSTKKKNHHLKGRLNGIYKHHNLMSSDINKKLKKKELRKKEIKRRKFILYKINVRLFRIKLTDLYQIPVQKYT